VAKSTVPTLEQLETRTTPSVSFLDGVLTIKGTSGDDLVILHRTADELVVEGQHFPRAAVLQVKVCLKEGMDYFRDEVDGADWRYATWFPYGAGTKYSSLSSQSDGGKLAVAVNTNPRSAQTQVKCTGTGLKVVERGDASQFAQMEEDADDDGDWNQDYWTVLELFGYKRNEYPGLPPDVA